MKRTLALAACALILSSAIRPAVAADEDTYPNRPIKMLVGFAPGAATDVTARILAQKLSDQMKVGVVVENRVGAGGDLVFGVGARAAPDGYTLIFNTGSLVQNYAMAAKRPYDPIRDFIPISTVSDSPLVVMVSTALPVNTIQEFVAYAKTNPDKVAYSSAGVGNITHIGSLLFQSAVGINTLHVPYPGSNPAMADLAAGRVQYSTPTVASASPFFGNKAVKPLAVLSLARSPALPDVPTADETVAKGLQVSSWLGVLAPAKTPAPIIARLNKEIGIAMNDPETKSRLLKAGSVVATSTPEQYAAFIKSELQRWTKIIEQNNLKSE